MVRISATLAWILLHATQIHLTSTQPSPPPLPGTPTLMGPGPLIHMNHMKRQLTIPTVSALEPCAALNGSYAVTPTVSALDPCEALKLNSPYATGGAAPPTYTETKVDPTTKPGGNGGGYYPGGGRGGGGGGNPQPKGSDDTSTDTENKNPSVTVTDYKTVTPTTPPNGDGGSYVDNPSRSNQASEGHHIAMAWEVALWLAAGVLCL